MTDEPAAPPHSGIASAGTDGRWRERGRRNAKVAAAYAAFLSALGIYLLIRLLETPKPQEYWSDVMVLLLPLFLGAAVFSWAAYVLWRKGGFRAS